MNWRALQVAATRGGSELGRQEAKRDGGVSGKAAHQWRCASLAPRAQHSSLSSHIGDQTSRGLPSLRRTLCTCRGCRKIHHREVCRWNNHRRLYTAGKCGQGQARQERNVERKGLGQQRAIHPHATTLPATVGCCPRHHMPQALLTHRVAWRTGRWLTAQTSHLLQSSALCSSHALIAAAHCRQQGGRGPGRVNKVVHQRASAGLSWHLGFCRQASLALVALVHDNAGCG